MRELQIIGLELIIRRDNADAGTNNDDKSDRNIAPNMKQINLLNRNISGLFIFIIKYFINISHNILNQYVR